MAVLERDVPPWCLMPCLARLMRRNQRKPYFIPGIMLNGEKPEVKDARNPGTRKPYEQHVAQ
jgi:hypothetical protein